MRRLAWLGLVLAPALLGCTEEDPVGTADAYTLRVTGICADGQGTIHAAASMADGAGEPVKLGTKPRLTVETRAEGSSSWQTVEDITVGGKRRIDLALVADNSSSEAALLGAIQNASKTFAHDVLGGGPSNRVGLVRVSTSASVLSELTTSATDIDAAVDGMFITNGWTALWDGVRLGKQVLADGENEADACGGGASPAIVLFTDGRDNNSSHEHETSVADDGIDTSSSDLAAMTAEGVQTPIHVVGVGDTVDEATLSSLAAQTGGRYVSIDGYGELESAFDVVETDVTGALPIAFAPEECAKQVRVTVTVDGHTAATVVALPELCQ